MFKFLKKIIMPFNGETLKIYAAAILAALTAGAIFLGVNSTIGITSEAPRITIGDDNVGTVIIVPAIGDEGFPVAAFCEDERTTVSSALIPGSEGRTYQLVRITDTDDGPVPEMVKWSTGADVTNRVAAFYYIDDEGVQQSVPAVVDKAAEDCIVSKAVD